MASKPTVLLPIAAGTNRNQDLADAFVAAGADVNQIPLQALRDGDAKLSDHQMLAIPGGFSYGDALGAGRLLALDLRTWFEDQLLAAAESGMPMFGVCNGFQALVASGLLPGETAPAASLAHNSNGNFECRWVELSPTASQSPWLAEVDEPLWCPVAHGEGRFVASDIETVEELDLVALRYSSNGVQAAGEYPANPNGSVNDVAGITDSTGLVFGLMPHPENHIWARQNPLRGRSNRGTCLSLFESGVKATKG